MLRGSGPSAEILGDGDEASKNGVKDLTYRLSEIEEEFQCAVCLDLIVLPTTLNCGHSFCRHCLAHWFDCGKRTECPSCQQVGINNYHVLISYRKLTSQEDNEYTLCVSVLYL